MFLVWGLPRYPTQPLTRKIYSLDIPRGWHIRWSTSCHISISAERSLRTVSLGRHIPAGIPQRTKLGPWLFLLMLNDLRVPQVETWKYVDDTTVAEIVLHDASDDAQAAVKVTEDWFKAHKMQLNAEKCKVMVIDFISSLSWLRARN